MTGSVYIQEFSSLGIVKNEIGQLGHWPPVATYKVPINGVTSSQMFATATVMILMEPDAICSFDMGTSPNATTAANRINAGEARYYAIAPNSQYYFMAVTNV